MTPMENGTSETPDDRSLFDSIAELLPAAQRQHFYRRMTHLRQIQPDDDLLQVVEATGFLTLIAREVPCEIAAERRKIEALLENAVTEITRAMRPATIVDSLRRELDGCKLRETTESLTTLAAELSSACSQLTTAFGNLSDLEGGSARRITQALLLMQTELANATIHVGVLTANLRQELRSGVAIIATAALLLGLLLGVLSRLWFRVF